MSQTNFDFCNDWLFKKEDITEAATRDYDDSDWENIDLPHSWNVLDMSPGQARQEAYVGPAWYRKHFGLSKDTDQRYLMLFEAVGNFSEVWVDGCFVGGYDGGFLDFRLDITDALSDAVEHVVAVRTDNAFRVGKMPPELLDWERYGGIYRPVWLQERRAAYIDHKSIRIETPLVTSERGEVKVGMRVMEWGRSRELKVRHSIRDAENHIVAEISEDFRTVEGRTVASDLVFEPIDNPELWSVERPYLYSIRTELLEDGNVIDCETNPFGFRWFAFDAQEGFSLNGESMKLCGINAHQDFPGLGPACPERFHRRDIEIMKSAGINFLRTSHYPRNERALDYCDRLGILVMEEQPFWHGSLRANHGEALIDYGRRMMRDMVEHHGNHPCIIAWNTVNEVMLTPDDPDYHAPPEEKWKRRRLQEKEWPFARRGLSSLYDELKKHDPSRPVSMIIGGSHRENEAAGMTRLADMVGYNGGAFHAEVDGRPLYDVHKEVDPERISFMSEGILNKDPAIRADWEKELVFWETPALHWSRIYERPWFCGGAMWVFADYSAKGVYRIRGMVDYSRLPYESYYFFQSQWTEALMAHICCHWDWDVAEGTERRVVVFTNGKEAELFLNGESRGTGRPNTERWPHLPHSPMEWTVPYHPGKLEVIARCCEKEIRDERITSGEKVGVLVEAENEELRADGQDVAFLTATIVDAEGQRCYTAPETELKVSVDGPGCAALPPRFTARGGIARFAVRSEMTPGEIRVQVSGGGLTPSTIMVRSVG